MQGIIFGFEPKGDLSASRRVTGAFVVTFTKTRLHEPYHVVLHLQASSLGVVRTTTCWTVEKAPPRRNDKGLQRLHLILQPAPQGAKATADGFSFDRDGEIVFFKKSRSVSRERMVSKVPSRQVAARA